MRPGIVVALLAALGASTASAHVEVLPATVVAEAPQEVTIRVPTEGTMATTGVTIRIPERFVVAAIAEPPPGWTARAIRTADGRLSGVEWSGGRIAPGRYLEFAVLGTPASAGRATWPAVQRFADGTGAEWTGGPDVADGEPAPGAPGPAAVMTVNPAGASPVAEDGDSDLSAGTWLGLIAIGIAALAALATGLLWSSRPMTLPDDE